MVVEDCGSMSRPRFAYLLLLLAPAFFASNMLVARWAAGAIPPVGMAFWRWFLTFLLLLPLVASALWRARAAALREAPHLLVLGGLGMGVCGAPVYVGAETTSATNIGLLYAGSPVLIVLLGRAISGARIGRRQAAGIALCLLGVVIVVLRGDPRVLSRLALSRGDLWVLFAVSGWALYSVLLKHWRSALPLTARFAAIALGGVVVMVPFYAAEIASGHPTPFDATSVATLLVLALVPGLGAYLSYSRLVAELGPARTSVLIYLVPLYTAVLAWALLGEGLAPYHLAGAALIAPGLFLATRSAPA
jgi:drug/metabolite transporter (DMT)-like permease